MSIEIFDSFDDMGLSKNLLRGIYSEGFEKPSNPQKVGIVPIINGKDLLFQSQSGTGKTGTFSISAIQRIESLKDTDIFNETSVLILSPTRELAEQTFNVVNKLSKYITDLSVELVIGGTDFHEEARKLKTKPHIIIGTLGRIINQIEKGNLNTMCISLLIIDEADEMLKTQHKSNEHVTFKEQIRYLYESKIPKDCQTILVSATYSEEVIKTADLFLKKDYIKIQKKIEEVALKGIRQFRVSCANRLQKEDALKDIYQSVTITQAVVFVNSKYSANKLHDFLSENKFIVSIIHSDLTQKERETVIRDFRSGKSRILISTDIFSRGIDVQGVSLVFNFEISKNIDNYIHRIGRSGRFGRKGNAINFVSPEEEKIIDSIETHYQKKIEELPDNFAEIIDRYE
jgi:superfamily II DNA/RNA helicase